MPAKHNGMIKIDKSPEESEPTVKRVTHLLRSLAGSLGGRGGRVATYVDMEQWTGVPQGTLTDWFGNRGRPTADFLLQLLERLAEPARHGTIDLACKTFPKLEGKRLVCDATTISQLKTIACQMNGLTFITGTEATDEARTYLLTALGNTFLDHTERPRRISGIDAHKPDWFVPLPGVNYLQNRMNPAHLREAVQELWPDICAGKNHLVVLNRIWSAAPNFQRDIKALANDNNVVVADANVPDLLQLRRSKLWRAHLISVTEDPKSKQNILVTIQAA